MSGPSGGGLQQPLPITNEVLHAHLKCRYKAHLLLAGERGRGRAAIRQGRTLPTQPRWWNAVCPPAMKHICEQVRGHARL